MKVILQILGLCRRIDRMQTRNAKEASALVHLVDGSQHLISVRGWSPMDLEVHMDAKYCLQWRFNRDGFCVLNDGTRIPHCNITRIDPIKVVDYYVTYHIQGIDDLFGDNLTFTKISESY